jgi:hypothetical protein
MVKHFTLQTIESASLITTERDIMLAENMHCGVAHPIQINEGDTTAGTQLNRGRFAAL